MLPTELTTLQVFHGLDEPDAARICKGLLDREFSPGESVLTEGDDTQALWLILSGECIVSRNSEQGERILAVLNAGDVFGEMSFVRNAPHSASIIAATPLKVCCYKREEFLTFAAERPEAGYMIATNIACVLAERLRRMDTWVCDMFERPKTHDDSGSRDEWQNFRSAVYTNWDF